MNDDREHTRGKAALMAFGLGWFGAHRFYLEEHGRGIAYGVFFWTFVPLLLSVRDGLRYLTMSDVEFDRRYNATGLVIKPHEERPAIPVGAAPQVNVTVTAPTGDGDAVSKLEKLAALKEKGLLSDEEFAAQKARLLEKV